MPDGQQVVSDRAALDAILNANRRGAIEGDRVRSALLSIRSEPEQLLALASALLNDCNSQSAGWLLPPICGWLPLTSLDAAAVIAESHQQNHPACSVAREIQEHHRLRRLGAEAPPVLHIAYPETVVNTWTVRQPLREGHPTWVIATSAAAEVGGAGGGRCPRCGGTGECLLAVPGELIGEPDPGRVDFVWCPACSPYTEVATAHRGNDGNYQLDEPVMMVDVEVEPVEPIEAIGIDVVELAAEWRVQDWMWSNGIENLHRIGGLPTWIQHETTPTCPDCLDRMKFVAQVAVEDLYDAEGLTYLHLCPTCWATGVVYQQT
jgi:hypothetical protein